MCAACMSWNNSKISFELAEADLRSRALENLKAYYYQKMFDLGFRDPSPLIKDFPDNGIRTACGAGLLSPPTVATTSEHFKTVVAPLTAKYLDEQYKLLQEKLVIQNQSTQKPYWIIVSDEGHSRIPHKHLTRTQADSEALRLSEANPGRTFTVFESKHSLFTPKAETKKTEYTDQFYYTFKYHNNCVPF